MSPANDIRLLGTGVSLRYPGPDFRKTLNILVNADRFDSRLY